MSKRSYKELIGDFVKVLKEEPLEYSRLARRLDINYDSVKMHAEILEKLGIVKIDKTEIDPANGRPSYKVSLTTQGKESAKKF